ncbi:SOS response-associated peptidase family protein [Flagellimonas zhangzhouensis]|uniref:Abasic site processing protein n=1 Tax=Flagellimonas zhangzhouensis TaxID=1073328 RepID=A0A1H2VN18_9FLAO|nr:SOS response-associated peptidase family protein [Allomuricauda zhangzhouensis]SDQ06750.1 Putative SOS response-associated peptidase YedK [Allomuricauda zhangzhouensis]SDW69722.1 Putative SOS response-associated peptidase YedK [Allomuricauda zhangzhouensis]
MIYKLSNVAEREMIEEEFGLSFRYPNLYKPNPVINGFNESNLSVVTMANKSEITFAIWGLMPQDFEEEWANFQDKANTLNVPIQDLEHINWMKESLTERRCLIIVTGFYTHLVKKGKTLSFYLHQPSNKPFYLAGTYNILEDGFRCTALITDTMDSFTSNYHDLSHLAPVIIPKEKADTWLSKSTSTKDLKKIMGEPVKIELKAEQLSSDFFDHYITTQNTPSTTRFEKLMSNS